MSKRLPCVTRVLLISLAALPFISSSAHGADPSDGTTASEKQQSLTSTETIVFLRHGERTAQEYGQLTPQGLNRALALSKVLPAKFGKPDYLFAPDPGEKIGKGEAACNYVRPLATIEPTAILLDMPVQTPCGYSQISKLIHDLTQPTYANSKIFVAWEHAYAGRAASDLIKQFGGNISEVPRWSGGDFDSLYVVKIIRVAGQPTTATFTLEHEGLDHLSKSMPTAATK
jgi:hypothetical protein